MDKKPKILIHCPIGYMYEESYNSILNLDTTGLEVDFYFTYFNPIDPRWDEQGREKDSRWRYNIAFKMNKARQIVLAFKYDFMLNVESDMIIPKNTLKELLKYAKLNNVVGALYRARAGRNPNTPLCLHIKMPNGQITWPDEDYIKDKEVIEAYTIPFGCTLFGRRVLELINFKEGIDGTFALETDRLGIKKLVITSVRAKHIDRNGIIWEV